MENGVSLTSLTPTITLSTGATVSPLSGAAQDFTNPFNYKITAEDGTTTQIWTVTVTVASAVAVTGVFSKSFYLYIREHKNNTININVTPGNATR